MVAVDASGWSVQRQRLPAGEAPDGALPFHHLCIQLDGPSWREDRDDGRWHRRQLNPGDVTLRPAGVPGRAAWARPVDVLAVTLDPATFATATGGRRLTDRVHTASDPVAGNLAEALLGADTAGVTDAIITALSAHLSDRYGHADTEADTEAGAGVRQRWGTRPLSTDAFARVRDYIADGLAEPLLVADLAAAVPMSPHHFARAFRETSGLTPHAYVMERRVEAARDALTRTVLPIADIARHCGFSDRGHLARHTRARYQLSPGELRALGRPGHHH